MRSCFIDSENSELEAAGPTARTIETPSCARPFVVPSEALFGDAAAMKMNTAPKHVFRREHIQMI